MTPADLIVKALGDLTQALKGRTNMKGIVQIKALPKIDELLNNIPTINKTPTRKVTFDEATKPPQEVQAAPRVNNMSKSAKEHTQSIQKSLTSHLPLTHHLQGWKYPPIKLLCLMCHLQGWWNPQKRTEKRPC